jgi:outer membrane protein
MSGIKRVLPACCLVLILGAAPAAAQTVKLGVFDAQSVSENTEMGKRIQAELTAFTEGKEGEITQRQQRVAELRKQLAEQSLSLSSEKRAELEKSIQRHMLELQSFQEAASRELELEYASATKEFQDKLVLAIDTFGKDEGFAVILDRSQVAWFDSATDVTSAVIDRFNRMFPDTAAEGQGE